jgi:hypothetical protein
VIDHLSWWQWLVLGVYGPTTAVAIPMIAGVAVRAAAERLRRPVRRIDLR